MTAPTSNNPDIVTDRIISTPKGDVHLLIDRNDMLEYSNRYYDKLRMGRGIPFDLGTISSNDPMKIYMATHMPWATPMEVIATVNGYYEKLDSDARRMSYILAWTRHTHIPKSLQPEPYEPDASRDEWDTTDLPEIAINLLNPIERRLKQIMDMIASNQDTATEFFQIMQTMYIEAERRNRQQDEDGFQSGRSSGSVSAQAIPDGLESETSGDTTSLASVPKRAGNSKR